jgi:hypothetical protein
MSNVPSHGQLEVGGTLAENQRRIVSIVAAGTLTTTELSLSARPTRFGLLLSTLVTSQRLDAMALPAPTVPRGVF